MSDKVFYDENCYVCSLEISLIRKKGETCGIQFVDISKSDFAEKYSKEMIGCFDGEETIGIETFRLMYEKMGYTRIVKFSRLPLIKHFFNTGYKIFAYGIRPYLPKRS